MILDSDVENVSFFPSGKVIFVFTFSTTKEAIGLMHR
jgi:hypothetical protein